MVHMTSVMLHLLSANGREAVRELEACFEQTVHEKSMWSSGWGEVGNGRDTGNEVYIPGAAWHLNTSSYSTLWETFPA